MKRRLAVVGRKVYGSHPSKHKTGLAKYPYRLMGPPANKWCVEKAVLKQYVKGHSDVKDSGWMLYSELTARHRTRHN